MTGKKVSLESDPSQGDKDKYDRLLRYVFLDDGTENIRAVFFKSQVEHLLKKSQEEITLYRVSPELLPGLKNEILGTQIIVNGRVSKNEMFSRLEFVAQSVNFPNPEDEIKRMETAP